MHERASRVDVAGDDARNEHVVEIAGRLAVAIAEQRERLAVTAPRALRPSVRAARDDRQRGIVERGEQRVERDIVGKQKRHAVEHRRDEPLRAVPFEKRARALRDPVAPQEAFAPERHLFGQQHDRDAIRALGIEAEQTHALLRGRRRIALRLEQRQHRRVAERRFERRQFALMRDVNRGDERGVFRCAMVEFGERFVAFENPHHADEFGAQSNRAGDARRQSDLRHRRDANRFLAGAQLPVESGRFERSPASSAASARLRAFRAARHRRGRRSSSARAVCRPDLRTSPTGRSAGRGCARDRRASLRATRRASARDGSARRGRSRGRARP